MKKIREYLNKFYTDHFNWKEFSFALLFVFCFCVFRYYTFIPYFDEDISLLTSWWFKAYLADMKLSFHFVLYLTPILLGYLIHSITHKHWTFWKNPAFILLLLFGVFIFSFRSSITFMINDWLENYATYAHVDWLNRILSTIARGLFLFLVLFTYWYFTDRKNQPFYGFSSKKIDLKPYLIMLGCMLPLIAAASSQSDFLSSYPRVQRIASLDMETPSHWKFYAIYEFLYGLDFFSIEFFFRGFMILGFVSIVGPKAIIPVAYMYVVIHWNKPMGELISSFFGGSLLGIISYYSKSIWGGIIVHVGIAWLMEIGAFVSKYFFQ